MPIRSLFTLQCLTFAHLRIVNLAAYGECRALDMNVGEVSNLIDVEISNFNENNQSTLC